VAHRVGTKPRQTCAAHLVQVRGIRHLGDLRRTAAPDHVPMDLTSFHKLRQAVQENASPAHSEHVVLLLQHLQHLMQGSGLFSEVELGRTDDLDQLVIGVSRCADGILPWEAGVGVEQIWQRASANAVWEAHFLGSSESLMELEGALTVDDSGHYVTVHLVAEPATVSEGGTVAEPQQVPAVVEGVAAPASAYPA
jgi:hypothetical protein